MDWSGVYFGVGSGNQWSSIDVHQVPSAVNISAGSANPGIGITSDHDEWFVSAHLGYQLQWRTFVFGVEGGWMSTIRDRDGDSRFCDSVTAVLSTPILRPGDFCRARLNDILTIGGRVGWAAGKWMPYVTGGYATGAFDFDARTAAPGPAGARLASVLQEETHERLDGWYIGAGFEWVISPGWTTGIEYRHYEFNCNDTRAFTGCAGSTPGCQSTAVGLPLEKVRMEASTDAVEARVSWRWAREPTAAPPLK
jgi:opacity protein-like surface antigen